MRIKKKLALLLSAMMLTTSVAIAVPTIAEAATTNGSEGSPATASTKLTLRIGAPEPPQPQQGAGSSVINTADLAGDIKKIENKFVATAQLEVKIFLSASDFNKNKVEDTVTANVNATTDTTSNLTQAEKRAEEQQRFENFYTKMFNAKFSSTKEMTFLQKLLSAIYYNVDKIIK